jgi:hypothetical protein
MCNVVYQPYLPAARADFACPQCTRCRETDVRIRSAYTRVAAVTCCTAVSKTIVVGSGKQAAVNSSVTLKTKVVNMKTTLVNMKTCS